MKQYTEPTGKQHDEEIVDLTAMDMDCSEEDELMPQELFEHLYKDRI